MLNEEKIILMTQMASYEENEGKKNMAIGRYFRSDYIAKIPADRHVPRSPMRSVLLCLFFTILRPLCRTFIKWIWSVLPKMF